MATTSCNSHDDMVLQASQHSLKQQFDIDSENSHYKYMKMNFLSKISMKDVPNYEVFYIGLVKSKDLRTPLQKTLHQGQEEKKLCGL